MVENLLGQLTESRGTNEDNFESCISRTSRGGILPRFRSSSFLRKRRRLPRFSTKRFAILNRTCPTLLASPTVPVVQREIYPATLSSAFNIPQHWTRSLT